MRITSSFLARTAIAAALFGLSTDAIAQSTARRVLRPSDVYLIKDIRDPQLSPEGAWVAYTVTTPDSAKDKSDTDIWMTSWDGTQSIRLTATPESESSPRFSPDGRYLAFLSGRQEGKGAQVWLLDRRGGEAQRITQVKGGVSDIVWSPDSKRLALVVDEETDSLARLDTAEHKTPKPIVIDRYEFKRDVSGYLGSMRSHLAVLDVGTKKVTTLTSSLDDDESPSWSPDGRSLAFIRTPIAEPSGGGESDVFVIEATSGAAAKRLTDFPGPDTGRPAWSPDGRWLAFVRGDEPKFYAYHTMKLAIVSADGSAPARVVSAKLDRAVSSPRFAADGRSVYVMIEDDRAQPLARVRVADGRVERVLEGRRVLQQYSISGDRIAVLATTTDKPADVFAVDGGALRKLSSQNDSLYSSLVIAPVEDLTSRSSDGTEVHGLVFRPPTAPTATHLPTILWIHGGPNSQDGYNFSLERQLYAANGYLTLAVNYRGSGGRGSAYQKAIYADWGNKEVQDLLGAVDEVVKRGLADPDRLGIGGWSYGGILTDYTIATTPRFKAAISGAGSANQFSMFGADEYIRQWNIEVGYPWQNRDLWIKLSYPFFQADRIKTPTMFMGGANDFNVPLTGGEQMYAALRTLGVPTKLVIYPNQFHSISIPSYRKDRLERYVAWYDRWLKPGATAASGGTSSSR